MLFQRRKDGGVTSSLPPLAVEVEGWLEQRIAAGGTDRSAPCLLVVHGNVARLAGQLTAAFGDTATVLCWRSPTTTQAEPAADDVAWSTFIELLISVVDVVVPPLGPALKGLPVVAGDG